MGEIKLSKEIEVVTSTVKVDKLTVRRIVDIPEKKMTMALCGEFGRPVILWSGDAYNAGMSWTLADIEARLKEIVEGGNVQFGQVG